MAARGVGSTIVMRFDSEVGSDLTIVRTSSSRPYATTSGPEEVARTSASNVRRGRHSSIPSF